MLNTPKPSSSHDPATDPTRRKFASFFGRKLPPEITLQIFKNLSLEELMAIKTTCRQAYYLSKCALFERNSQRARLLQQRQMEKWLSSPAELQVFTDYINASDEKTYWIKRFKQTLRNLNLTISTRYKLLCLRMLGELAGKNTTIEEAFNAMLSEAKANTDIHAKLSAYEILAVLVKTEEESLSMLNDCLDIYNRLKFNDYAGKHTVVRIAHILAPKLRYIPDSLLDFISQQSSSNYYEIYDFYAVIVSKLTAEQCEKLFIAIKAKVTQSFRHLGRSRRDSNIYGEDLKLMTILARNISVQTTYLTILLNSTSLLDHATNIDNFVSTVVQAYQDAPMLFIQLNLEYRQQQDYTNPRVYLYKILVQLTAKLSKSEQAVLFKQLTTNINSTDLKVKNHARFILLCLSSFFDFSEKEFSTLSIFLKSLGRDKTLLFLKINPACFSRLTPSQCISLLDWLVQPPKVLRVTRFDASKVFEILINKIKFIPEAIVDKSIANLSGTANYELQRISLTFISQLFKSNAVFDKKLAIDFVNVVLDNNKFKTSIYSCLIPDIIHTTGDSIC